MDVATVWRYVYRHEKIEELNDVTNRALTACKREKLRKKTSTEWFLSTEFLKLKSCLKSKEVETRQSENFRHNITNMHNYGIAEIGEKGRDKNW